MNTVTLMGRLSQDPEIRHASDGSIVYNFNFAVNRRFIRNDGTKADFFRCVAFGKTAERLEKCQIQKGVKLLVQGELQNSIFTDQNGQRRRETQIIVNDFDFCESKPTAETPKAAPAPKKAMEMQPQEFIELNDGIDAELPFV